jgi:hypothetical protein
MEGRLYKWGGFFTRWREYKYILHEGVLLEYNIVTNEELGAVHLAISKISVNPKQPLQVIIHNGISQIYLRAKTVKEKVEWFNALEESKGEAITKEKRDFEKQAIINPEKLSDKLATDLFKKFDPLYQKIGKVWSTQAQFEEVMSIMDPELKKSPKLNVNREKLLGLTNQLKEEVAEVLYDLEIARKDFEKAIKHFSDGEDGLDFEEPDSLSNEDLQSRASLRSVKIMPEVSLSSGKPHEEEKNNVNLDDDEEEKHDPSVKRTSTNRSIDPKDLSEDALVRT